MLSRRYAFCLPACRVLKDCCRIPGVLQNTKRFILEVGYPDAALVAVKDEAGYRFWMDGGNGEIDGIPGTHPSKKPRSSRQLCVWFACKGERQRQRQSDRGKPQRVEKEGNDSATRSAAPKGTILILEGLALSSTFTAISKDGRGVL